MSQSIENDIMFQLESNPSYKADIENKIKERLDLQRIEYISYYIENCEDNTCSLIGNINNNNNSILLTLDYSFDKTGNLKIDTDTIMIEEINQKSEEEVRQQLEEDKLNFDIDYQSYNITYEQIANMYEQKQFNIPDMQRSYVWNSNQASKLIESILIGLPLPSIFLVKDEGKYTIVDGLQRIITIYSFMYNKPLPIANNTKSGFTLSGVSPKFNGKNFEELKKAFPERMLTKFSLGIINITQFTQSKPDTENAMYMLFERLNGGGTTLSQQQMRNSVYYGIFNQKLNELSKIFESYFNDKQIRELLPSEYLLRVISIYLHIISGNKKGVIYKNLLSETMQYFHMKEKVNNVLQKDNNSFKENIEELFLKLKRAYNNAKELLGDYLFKKVINGKTSNQDKITPIIFESTLVSLMIIEDQNLTINKNDIKVRYSKIFSSDDYDNYFKQHTGTFNNICGRIESMKRVFIGEE